MKDKFLVKKEKMSLKHVKKYGFIFLILLILIIPIHGVWCNTALETTYITIESEKLPEKFSTFRIAQVSDLHNVQFRQKKDKLLTMLKETEPDMIAITGDVVDASRTDIDVAIAFAAEAMKIAPCYYVTGNHEAALANAEYERLEKELKAVGVIVLRDEMTQLSHEGNTLQLIGVDDPAFDLRMDRYSAPEAVMMSKLNSLTNHEENYTILLSHRPELFEVYGKAQVDLVLSGHAHGGQFRLPFIGGVIAPNQGLFPKYDAGLFIDGNTHMVVSRGIGNSIIPIRVNNRPEIVVVEIKRK